MFADTDIVRILTLYFRYCLKSLDFVSSLIKEGLSSSACKVVLHLVDFKPRASLKNVWKRKFLSPSSLLFLSLGCLA